MKAEEVWRSTQDQLEQSFGTGSATHLVRSAKLMRYSEGQFVIGVANGYVKTWIEQRLHGDLCRALSTGMGRTVDVRVVLNSTSIASTTSSSSVVLYNYN